jgi:restriction system protein
VIGGADVLSPSSIVQLEDEELDEVLLQFHGSFDDPYSFERFLVAYLEAFGFDEIELTQRTRDGGVDLKAIRKGIDVVADRDWTRYYIQAKRLDPSSNVPINDVRALRGVMPDGFKGIFITTGKFSSSAERFASESESRPLILLDGKALVRSCIEKGLGFRFKPVFSRESLGRILGEFREQDRTDEPLVEHLQLRDVKKAITTNDIRARILSIPASIFEQLPLDATEFRVSFSGSQPTILRLNRERKFFAGITALNCTVNAPNRYNPKT